MLAACLKLVTTLWTPIYYRFIISPSKQLACQLPVFRRVCKAMNIKGTNKREFLFLQELHCGPGY